jgi:hypothetical protein
LDHDLADVVEGYLVARGAAHRRYDQADRVIFEIAEAAELAAGIGDGQRFATGDARGLTDAEPLNLAHPLVRAAIAYARAWTGGNVELWLPHDADPDLIELAGKVGVLAVVLIDYAGFEPVQHLIAAGAIDGAPLDPLLAARIMRLQASDRPVPGSITVDPQDLEDSIDEAVFVDQRETEKDEQTHFERAIGQLERFVEDKLIVCRRELASVVEKLRSARVRRDTVVGFTDRARVEEEIARLANTEAALERRIAALDSRADEVYQKWRNDYHERRYRAPIVTRLFQIAFQIVPAQPRKS